MATPTPPGPDDPYSSLAKLYQSVIASAVQAIADRKKIFGRGKNETNIRLSLRSEDLWLWGGRHSGMVRRTGPGISRFRVRCFASPRNDPKILCSQKSQTLTTLSRY